MAQKVGHCLRYGDIYEIRQGKLDEGKSDQQQQ